MSESRWKAPFEDAQNVVIVFDDFYLSYNFKFNETALITRGHQPLEKQFYSIAGDFRAAFEEVESTSLSDYVAIFHKLLQQDPGVH